MKNKITIVILLMLVLSSTFGQDRKEKTIAIINKLNLIENQKSFFEFQITPIKYQATGNDSIRLLEIENRLTEDEILKRLNTAFYEIFDKRDIDDIYRFVQTKAYEKFFNSKESSKVISDNFRDINDEIEEITNNLNKTINKSSSLIEIIDEPQKKFKPIPVDKVDGFYEVVDYKNYTKDENIKLNDKPSLISEDILEVKKEYNNYNHQPEISIKLTEEGGRKFFFLTKRNIGKPIAIVIGKNIVSLPNVNSEIIGGKVSISGDFTEEEVDRMIKLLKEN